MPDRYELNTNEIECATQTLRDLYFMRSALKDHGRFPITVSIGQHNIGLYQCDTVIRAAALVECEQQITETE